MLGRFSLSPFTLSLPEATSSPVHIQVCQRTCAFVHTELNVCGLGGLVSSGGLRLHMQRIVGMLDVVENAELHETTSLVYFARHLPLISARSLARATRPS